MDDARFEKVIEEIWDLFKETDKRFKDLEKRFKETDKRFKETDKRFRQTDRNLTRLERLFTGQWGKLMESLFEAGITKLFQERGIEVWNVAQRVRSELDGKGMEIDLLLSGKGDVVLVEVKTTLKVQDVREFLKDIRRFTVFFPQYKGFHLYGAVACLKAEEESDRFSYRQGLFVLKVGKEGLCTIANDPSFKPKDFSIEQ